MELLYYSQLELGKAGIQRLSLPLLLNANIIIDVLRLDELHLVVSGNKYFKLKYYLQEALREKKHTLVSFGGAYSNHLIATAYAANRLGLNSVGIVRGERPAQLSHTLEAAANLGMHLQFVNRNAYLNKEKLMAGYEQEKGFCIIPEGGYGAPGIKGAMEILDMVEKINYTHIVCAVGTGTMFEGLRNAALPSQTVMGIVVLKTSNDEYVQLPANDTMASAILYHHYHEGGYARKSNDLLQFMNDFYHNTGIPLDFVYTGKLMKAVLHLAGNNFFSPQSKVLVIHSGGLQGNASLPPGTLVYG